MTTRHGRQATRQGAPSELTTEQVDSFLKLELAEFETEVRQSLIAGFQGEIRFTVQVYDGRITRVMQDKSKHKKP